MGLGDKNELIASIRALNHSAKVEFLQKFSESDLRAYLDRVRSSAAVLCSPWVVKPQVTPYFR